MSRKKIRKSISSTDLIQILQVIHEESLIKKTDTITEYDLDLANSFLKDRGFGDHIMAYHQSGRKRSFPLNSERNVYEIRNLIFKNLDIELEGNLNWNEDFIWATDPLHAKWHFEHCLFKSPSLSMRSILFGWYGSFRFYKNEFEFGDVEVTKSWLFGFANGSRVLFQINDFKNSNIQISCAIKDSLDVQKLSWERREAYLVKDDSYYEAMIRKNLELPETVRLEIPDKSLNYLGLDRISFLGNKKIDELYLRCKANDYIFKGINCINRLHFNELDYSFRDLTSIYFSPRERIDPDFCNSNHHRKLFLSLREFGVKKQDTDLVNALDKQLNRIEYFLTKEQKVPFRSGSEWIEYWQDRTLYAWRRWSSDFYRSWFRPLLIGVLGYMSLNAFPWFWIEGFNVSDWIAFSLRRIDRIPFYTAWLKEFYGPVYEALPTGNKNWLRFIGLFQMIWATMCGFAFSKSIRK